VTVNVCPSKTPPVKSISPVAGVPGEEIVFPMPKLCDLNMSAWAVPVTSRGYAGDVRPIPIFPLCDIKRDEVAVRIFPEAS
jgi:hypothetical protein